MTQETKAKATAQYTAEEASKKLQQSMDVAEDAREKEYRHPTFAGLLFMGEFKPELLFPFPFQPEEDRKEADAFLEKLEAYLRANVDAEEIDRTHEIPKEVIEEMARMGVFAMKVPKEYDGLGFSQTNYCRAVVKVASHCGNVGVLVTAHQSIGVPQPLKLYGTEEQKAKYLPKFRQGQISAFALTEPDVGSDPAEMAAEARLSDDGTHYILNGEKLWCTNGTIADVIVVMAKTAPKVIKGKERKQISAFILEMDSPGIEIVQRCEFMGLRALYNGYIRFTDVKIPAENLIWDEGRGLAIALGTINVGRITLPAGCTGAAKQCLSIARRWGLERVQWGQPIGLHEEGRNKIAYIASTTLAMEAVTWLTCGWVDQGGVDIRIETAMAKLFCTEALWKIVDMTMQLRGGRGYEKGRSLAERGEPPYAVERIMRDCRVNLILEGSTEIMHLFLAREAMDPHFRRAMDLVKGKLAGSEKTSKILELLKFYSWWLPSQHVKGWIPGSYPEMGSLEKHFKFIKKASHKLARSIFYAMAKHKQGLERRQMLLARLVEVGTELFVMSATCSYAIGLKDQDAEKGDSPIALADYFCTLARRRIADHFDAVSDNDDRQANKLARRVFDSDMRWLEEGVIWTGPED